MLKPKHLAVLVALAAFILAAGCATIEQNSSSPDEVRAFFVTANEANFLGVQSFSSKQMDLSGYTHLMGVKYPPTLSVDVLSALPSRPYQAFAVLETSASSPSETYDTNLLEGIKNKARSIGADAIVFCRPSEGAGLTRLQASSKMVAIAIKYRLEDLPKHSKRP
jgi:hypothetical protein